MRHALADRLHDAGALVAEHDRLALRPQVPFGQMQVGVADAGLATLDQRLSGPGRLQQQLLDGPRAAHPAEHGGQDAK